MKYRVLYADPPWKHRDKCKAGNRGAAFKYPVMKTSEIIAMRPFIDFLCDEDALLCMWWVDTMPQDALAVCKGWGFKFHKMNGLVWRKLQTDGGDSFGMGRSTRNSYESALIGFRGKLSNLIASHSVRQGIHSLRREHSQKPDEAYDKLELLCGDVPRIELFSRNIRSGWSSWGIGVQRDTSKIVVAHPRQDGVPGYEVELHRVSPNLILGGI